MLGLMLAGSYVAASAASGGPGGFIVASILAVGPLIFIWWGAEVGQALGWEGGPRGFRSGRVAGVVIQAGGWLLLAVEVVGLVVHRP